MQDVDLNVINKIDVFDWLVGMILRSESKILI